MKAEIKERSGSKLPSDFAAEQRLKFEQVSELSGMGRSKIYALMKSGEFPQPERYGKRCSRWRAGTVIDFLNGERF